MKTKNTSYQDLIMKKKASTVVNSKVLKRPQPERQMRSNELESPFNDSKKAYYYTEKFQFWTHPWTFQFLSQLDALGYFSTTKIKSAQPIKTYAAVASEPAKLFAEASVGIQHRQAKVQLPCQDAVKISNKPRPILIVCDGAGSAAVSEIGSLALVNQLTRLCQSLEPIIKPMLDDTSSQTSIEHTLFVRIIIRHAIGILQDLAELHRRSIRDFRSTLNFVIVGTQQSLWIKVGDGEIIQEKIFHLNHENLQSEYHFCGEHNKGEFANQTQFIDAQLQFSDVQWGILDSSITTGIVLMSDGCAEKLVSYRRDQVAGQITQWLQLLRGDQLKVADVYKRFYSEEFINRSSGDDRSIALYSKIYQIQTSEFSIF